MLDLRRTSHLVRSTKVYMSPAGYLPSQEVPECLRKEFCVGLDANRR
jgi:hypothetical protein